VLHKYESKEALIPTEVLRRVERDIMLQIVDAQWKDHLYSLDHLKEGIGLRGYGQRDPLVEYKKESFALFQACGARGRGDRAIPLLAAPVQAQMKAGDRPCGPGRLAPRPPGLT
jgi:preprotein translocase subunit SecA